MSSRHAVGVVLTGGASERMGVDKATLVVDGKPMAVRVADALWEAGCHPVECQGGDVDAIAEYGLDVYPDEQPWSGPLAAIRDALDRHPAADVVTAACDLVDIDAATIDALIQAADGAGTHDAVVATSGGERHMVCWWRAGTAVRLAGMLGGGVTSFRAALERLHVVDVEVGATSVRNVNTPSDLTDRE